MVKLNPQEYAEKWTRRTKAATQDLIKGVERVEVTPSAEAIKKKDKLRANLNESIDNGTWERRLAKHTKADWQRDMIQKGAPRVAGGADAAKNDMASFGAELLSFEQTAQAEVRAMPDMTLEDSKARAVAWIDRMSKFHRS